MYGELEIELPEREYQDKAVELLETITKRIELNKHTNNNLLQLGDLIYNNFFNDSKNEWNVKTLKEISNNFDSKRKPMSSREREEHKGNYPYYGATSIIDYVDSYLFDEGSKQDYQPNNGKPANADPIQAMVDIFKGDK